MESLLNTKVELAASQMRAIIDDMLSRNEYLNPEGRNEVVQDEPNTIEVFLSVKAHAGNEENSARVNDAKSEFDDIANQIFRHNVLSMTQQITLAQSLDETNELHLMYKVH